MAQFPFNDIKFWLVLGAVIGGGNISGILNATNPDFRASSFSTADADALEVDLKDHFRQEIRNAKHEILREIDTKRFVEERECAAERQKIRDRLVNIENDHKHCMAKIRQHDLINR